MQLVIRLRLFARSPCPLPVVSQPQRLVLLQLHADADPPGNGNMHTRASSNTRADAPVDVYPGLAYTGPCGSPQQLAPVNQPFTANLVVE